MATKNFIKAQLPRPLDATSRCFEDGAKIDDILNVLKRPPLNARKQRESELEHDSRPTPNEVSIKFEFAGQKTLEVLT